MSVLSKIQSGILEGYELIREIDVPVDSTTVTFSDLNGDEDVEYILLCQIINPTTGGCNYEILPNGITSNLSCQYLFGKSTSLGASRLSLAIFISIEAQSEAFGGCHYFAKSGMQRRYVSHLSRGSPTKLEEWFWAGLWNETTTIITSFDVTASVASAIGAGSKLLLFRKVTVEERLTKGFEKVAEVEVAADSTSVTIEGLNGDVDEVYLIQAYFINKYAGTNAFEFEPNGATTNLTFQYIWASDTTKAANRINGGRASFSEAEGVDDTCFSRAVFYAKSGRQRRYVAHCSGYLTVREFLYAGIWNETTSNITSMRIISYWAGGLGAGSKIILYKLRK